MLPHLDAAYNLACWLLRDAHEAEDAVQDAYLKAMRRCLNIAVAAAPPGC
jgi:RNA polymerase sigma-70 factor (ECF subfamily)